MVLAIPAAFYSVLLHFLVLLIYKPVRYSGLFVGGGGVLIVRKDILLCTPLSIYMLFHKKINDILTRITWSISLLFIIESLDELCRYLKPFFFKFRATCEQVQICLAFSITEVKQLRVLDPSKFQVNVCNEPHYVTDFWKLL